MFQDAPPPPIPETEVEAVIVTAARLPPAAGDAAFSVIRLDAADLATSERLDEALGSVPAVSLFRRTSSLSANPTTQGISLRAVAPSGAGRTLVTLDGVPLNDPFGGWVLWSQVAPESLDGLDVLRGSGAGSYGAGALTGVIQLRERSAGGTLDASLAEDGGARIALAGGRPGDRVGLFGAVLHDRSDGYVAVRGRERGAADTSLDLEASSLTLRADVALPGSATLSARLGAYDEARGAGLVGARAKASGNVVSLTAARAPAQGEWGWRVQTWRRESDFANSSVSVAADRSSTTPANDQFETPAVGWGLNLAARRRIGGLEFELGADARTSEGETRERFRYMAGEFTRGRIAGGETAVAGVYAEGSWTTGPWLIAGGVRVDRWENTGGARLETDLQTDAVTLDDRPADRSGEVFSARLAARYDLGGGQALRAAAYTGFRPATLNELHRPFRVGNDITEANAALEPERLTGVEAGWAWTGDDASLQVTAFWTEIEDAIVNTTIGEGPGTFPRAGFVPAGGVLRERRNAGTIEAAGLEIEAEHRLSDRLTLTGALSATDARMDGGAAAPQLTGLRPAQAPSWSAVAGLDWRANERLSLSGQVRYESRRFDDDLNSRSLGPAAVADLRARWRLTPGAVAYVAADNLFDEDVEVSETGAGVPGYGPPRTIRIGLSVGW